MWVKMLLAFLVVVFTAGSNEALALTRITLRVESKHLADVMRQKDPRRYQEIRRIKREMQQLRQQMRGVPRESAEYRAGQNYAAKLRNDLNRAAGQWRGIVGTLITFYGDSNDYHFYVRKHVWSMVSGYASRYKGRRNLYSWFDGANWTLHNRPPTKAELKRLGYNHGGPSRGGSRSGSSSRAGGGSRSGSIVVSPATPSKPLNCTCADGSTPVFETCSNGASATCK